MNKYIGDPIETLYSLYLYENYTRSQWLSANRDYESLMITRLVAGRCALSGIGPEEACVDILTDLDSVHGLDVSIAIDRTIEDIVKIKRISMDKANEIVSQIAPKVAKAAQRSLSDPLSVF